MQRRIKQLGLPSRSGRSSESDPQATGFGIGRAGIKQGGGGVGMTRLLLQIAHMPARLFGWMP